MNSGAQEGNLWRIFIGGGSLVPLQESNDIQLKSLAIFHIGMTPEDQDLPFHSLLTSEIDLLHYLSYTILLHTHTLSLSLSLSHNHSSNILFWLKSLSGDSLAAAVKNLSCNARDRHGFHPWSGKIPRAVELLSPGATPTEPEHPGARALQREKPAPWEVCAPQWRVAPTLCN